MLRLLYASILAMGFQIAVSIKIVVLGIECLWSMKTGIFYLFFFIGGISNNPLDAIEKTYKNDLAMLKSYIPKFSVKPGSLLSKSSISLSYIIVVGNWWASFPEDYCGWFTGISLSFRHITISGAYGKSGWSRVWSFGIGITTSILSINVSKTFYFQITGENALNNNKNAILNAVDDQFGIFSLLFWLL